MRNGAAQSFRRSFFNPLGLLVPTVPAILGEVAIHLIYKTESGREKNFNQFKQAALNNKHNFIE